MSAIKEIRDFTGLSQSKMAEWLGIKKNLLQFAENGDRNLPQKASAKLNSITLAVQYIKTGAAANKETGLELEFTDSAMLAARHKKKMEFHQRSALGLRIKLRKLKAKHPQLNNRIALFAAIKNDNSASATDKKWIEMIEWFSEDRMSVSGLEAQALLQDKIDTHQEYAEIHKQRWKKFLGSDK